MASLATQEIPECVMSEGDDVDDEMEPKIWGRMFSLKKGFETIDFSDDSYTFGRDTACDIPFNEKLCKDNFQAYSKQHFKIYSEQTSSGLHVFLEDKSTNGTFINSEKVGKGNKQVLNNNDEISLAFKQNKVYLYTHMESINEGLHPQLTDKYTITKLLGKGAYGEVKLGFSKGTCDKYAIKVISKKRFSTGGCTQINDGVKALGEAKILQSLNHPCIVSVNEVIDVPDTLYIVLELIEGGELFDRVRNKGAVPETISRLYLYQMISAIKYLHDKGITHRDLKPENILLMTDEEETLIKVTDFGLSKFFDNGSVLKTFCGTPTYLAPEILLTAGRGSYTKAVDCWSLGVILFICLVGYPPFSEDRKDMPLTKQILTGTYIFSSPYWDNISVAAKDLVQKMLTVDPNQRITIQEAFSHRWLKDPQMIEKANSLMFPGSNGLMLSTLTMLQPGKRKMNDVDTHSIAKKAK
ncbi:serine/threonine-protein kinase Chk2 [Octopus bimaculoides]|uniref:Serine/threonine-protein kinase Chk2 n=1 Tax=Octopus bimaculoides TaxID=37653 RepID=A0A0L8G8I3_OCTBM|nr:serine/threonine-protein kinase Chk2 [Octopus bimaculoides]|eukprot:XP_014783139.1 PREDICTED: serine/threonine-protein kinase Chk2-like [Octopus bimaculoides]